YAGFSLTHRDMSSSVTFVTGTDKHGNPHAPEAWHRLAKAGDTLCILMGMRRIADITKALLDGGRAATTPTCIIEWGTRAEQRVLTGALAHIADLARDNGYKNPAVIVVGDVVTLREKLRWYDNRPLFGKRLLLPRAANQAAATAQLVRERGAEPLCMPLISIEDPPDLERVHEAARNLRTYDWIVLTSANGAERLLAALAHERLDARAFGCAKIGVIGPKTAEPLRRFGITPDLIAKEYVAEGLLDALLSQDQQPLRRALVFRAAEAREVLPEQLRAHGVEVDVVAAYQTRRLGEQSAERLGEMIVQHQVDAVLVTSSSIAEAIVNALGPTARTQLSQVTVASIGPITTQTLGQLGMRVDLTASEHTIPGLLDALESHMLGQQQPNPC
ncbi:MAG TPA: bifunctional uroporphyrinogen-III C-methyltransferase/uroporphyrinogen-III synthase, partial [Polyangiaceae bacterium]|nr:bifunctional uroporphyrinogen-III C-methyltransferase/uroporphyrinogen-III synthase [Polyangiaceae bacterium]